jgi:signal transduction histidine kinase
MILDDIVDRISGRWAASLKAWIFFAVIGSLGTASRSYALLGITHKESILFALAIVAINGPLYYIVSATLLRKRFTEQLSLTRIFTSYIIFWLTIAGTEVFLTVYVLHKTAYLGPQLFAPLFPDIFGFIASSYLLAEFEKNRNDISRLSFARSALVKFANESRQQVVAERNKLITAIQDSVFYQLDALKKQLTSLRLTSNRQEIERLAQELENYSANTIRSLSHEMAKDTGEGNPIDRLAFIGQKKIKNFSNVYAPYISFKLSMVVLIVVGGFHELSLNGYAGFFFQILTTLFLAPILFVGSIATRKCGPAKITLGFTYFLLTIFIAGYFTVLISKYLLANDIVLRNAYTGNVFAGRSLLSIIMASLIVTIVEARQKTYRDLVAMNEKLQVDLDWMENRSKELRKELASILHGPLQGRIAGIAMALRLIASNQDTSEGEKGKKLEEIEKLLTTVIHDVQELFKVEQNQPEASIVIKLINLRRSWEGIAAVTWSIEPPVFAALPASSFQTVSEILYEATSNSVRHGRAKTISVSLKVDSKYLIMTIADDGSGVSSELIPGAGFRKFSEHGCTYFFAQNVTGGAELTVRFPLPA